MVFRSLGYLLGEGGGACHRPEYKTQMHCQPCMLLFGREIQNIALGFFSIILSKNNIG